MLLEENTAIDLMLRGFGRSQVEVLTGVDIGYNGRALRAEATGIDRKAYKVEHVRSRVLVQERLKALDAYAEGANKESVLGLLGLAGSNLITLKELFGALSLGSEFDKADRRARLLVMREGMIEAHGVASAFALEDVREKAASTREDRYGARFTLAEGSSLAPVARESISRSRRDRAELSIAVTASPYGTVLGRLRERLVSRFGVDDVIADHRDETRYQYPSTFWIPSRDLFVELVESPRGGSNAARVVQEMLSEKKEAARNAGLNWVVLRDGVHGLDMDLWFDLGCPDGNDWDVEHSWIGDRFESSLRPSWSWPAVLDGRVGTSRKASKAANGSVIYVREIEMWDENPQSVRGCVRSRLLSNRHRYLGKLPEQMSDVELMRGMHISGLIRGYTAFDNSGMVQVIEQFQPTSIYDPCAGWGERLATCAGLGLGYLGVDVNSEVVAGHERMIEHYGLSEQQSLVGDAASFDARDLGHEMVFTCPPYGDTEIYTAHGAENLDEVAFLEWWWSVCEMAASPSTEVFAYQINQVWRDRMNSVLLSQGWDLLQQIDVGTHAVSHMTRNKDGSSRRREFEQVQVFAR